MSSAYLFRNLLRECDRLKIHEYVYADKIKYNIRESFDYCSKICKKDTPSCRGPDKCMDTATTALQLMRKLKQFDPALVELLHRKKNTNQNEKINIVTK